MQRCDNDIALITLKTKDEMNGGTSIAKINDTVANEDAFFSSPQCIAVSDGAGGCGLFADEWSRYLIDKLPKNHPITSFTELDEWVDGIWETFYDEHEQRAKCGDGIFLNKFYNEGSCATVAAAWMLPDNRCRWMAYGDSVVFHYNRNTDILEHSFTRLADFSNPPRLVSCKDPLEEEGFSSGVFALDASSVVFAASDALSHYIMMMYELSKRHDYREELAEEYQKPSGNSQLLKAAETVGCDFEKDVVDGLLHASENEDSFRKHIKELHEMSLIDMDDFTFVWIHE